MLNIEQQPIEISLPGNIITLKIPSLLKQSFTITNLTLRPVIIYPILSHEDELFLTTKNRIRILEAFEEVELTLGLKSITVPVRELVRPMLRLYFWEIKSFRDEDQLILEQDQLILESPQKLSLQTKLSKAIHTQTHNSSFQSPYSHHQHENELQLQVGLEQFQSMLKRNKLKNEILDKYQQKMFSIRNTSHSVYENMAVNKQNTFVPKNNPKLSPKRNSHNQSSEQESQSSQEPDQFSQLMYKDFDIEIQIDDSLVMVGSFCKTQLAGQKQLYLLQNIIRPQLVELTQTEKARQVEFIESKLFSECERLGKVKAIDRLGNKTHENHTYVDQVSMHSDKSIDKYPKTSNRQVKLKSGSLTIKIPDRRLPLEKYAIQYKGKISIQNHLHTTHPPQHPNTKPLINQNPLISCHFIQILTQKYFYLYRLSKILKYDYWYRENNSLKRKISDVGQNLVKRKEEKKRWKLPMLIDLDKLRFEDRKNNANRLGMEFHQQVKLDEEVEQQININKVPQQTQTQIQVLYEAQQIHTKPLLEPENTFGLQLIPQNQLPSLQTPSSQTQNQTQLPSLTQQIPQHRTLILQPQHQQDNSKTIQILQNTIIPESAKISTEQSNGNQELPEVNQQRKKKQQNFHSIQQPFKTFLQPLQSDHQPEQPIIEASQCKKNSKPTSSKNSSGNNSNQPHQSMLQFHRQGHNFDLEYTGPQMLRKKSQEYSRDEFIPEFIRQRYKSDDDIKEANDQGQDVIRELPRQDVEGIGLDIGKNQNESKKSPPKFLFPSNGDLKSTQEKQYTTKKALLSKSFSHSFSPQFSRTHQSPKLQFTQEMIVYPDPVLAMQISPGPSHSQSTEEHTINPKPQPTLYLLFRTHLLYFPLSNPQLKTIIKIDPMKVQDTLNYKTHITVYKNEQIIAANGCYLYWIPLFGQQAQWKYVQRKEIYCIQVIEEMKLLAVGGKNFSKLSLFGKETSRSNIKIYNCGKSERMHLFTYDIPINQPVGNVEEMKYITTPPSGAKLLATYTNHNNEICRLIFFRVRAYNNIEIYGKVELNDIGIQAIIGMKYNPKCQKLVVLEQVDAEHSALKRLKVKSMYEKAQVLTECIKMDLGNYEAFQIGGEKDTQWYSLVSKGKKVASIYRSNKIHNNPQKINVQKYNVEAVYDINQGQTLVKGFDFVKIMGIRK